MTRRDRAILEATLDRVSREGGNLSNATKAMIDEARAVVLNQCKAQRKAMREAKQLSIKFPVQSIPRRGRKRWAVYPFAMVAEARTLRNCGYSYKKIARLINKKFSANVSLFTVRDWTVQAYRATG